MHLFPAPLASVSVPRSADTVFTGGHVLTFDDASTVAEAIAVVGDRITAVGTDPAVLALAGPDCRVIPLSGRTVIPGIIDAHAHMEREGLKQISDTGALEKIIADVIAANPKQVEQYKGGKTTVINFLVGQAMKATRGQANVAAVTDLFKQKLG